MVWPLTNSRRILPSAAAHAVHPEQLPQDELAKGGERIEMPTVETAFAKRLRQTAALHVLLKNDGDDSVEHELHVGGIGGASDLHEH